MFASGTRKGTYSGQARGGLAVLAAVLVVLFAAFAAGTAAPAQAQDTPRFPLGSVVAATTGVNLRDQPMADGAKVAEMKVNERAIVAGGPFNNGWYWLEYKGTLAYAAGSLLVLVDEKYTPVPEVTSTITGTAQPVPSAQATSPASASPGIASPTAVAIPTTEVITPTTPGNYDGLWLGQMSTGGNVRVGPGLDKKILKGWWAGRRLLLYETAIAADGGVWYRVSEPPEQPMWVHSSLVGKIAPVKFEGARYKGRWVNINITQQIVTAYEDGTPVKVTLASTGTSKTPTELGVWKIYYRLPKQDMDGGNLAAGDYYNLKDVPYPQYFHMSGEGLHGTYWHDNFGRPMSHGCVNLSTPMSEWFYGWARIGTIVYVHM
jgi:lipoprotein-anchoring transpeptidase ErfK/SrfK